MPEEPKEATKPRYPLEFTIAGLLALFYSMKFGNMVLFFVGVPVLLICLYIGGGGRRPAKVPITDALIYVGIAVALVVGVILFAILTTPAK